MQIASPYKLKNGNWGAKIKGTAQEGETILVRAKSGKSWQATVAKVVWSGDGVSLVATVSSNSGSSSPRRRSQSGGKCRMSGCGQTAVRDGYCERCHFDEFDM